MILEMPEDSYAPVLLTVGLAVLFVGMLAKRWLIVGTGVVLVAAALAFWMWPRRQLLEREPAHD
jgi:protein-S-isoprenylcysteine O-methyltransferase Ste14